MDRHRFERIDPRRRRFLLAAAGLCGWSLADLVRATVPTPPRVTTDPFTLGVASGDPDAGGMVLWTRLAPEPLAPGGGMPPGSVPVAWEVADDERFARVVARGQALAEAAWAHSVHVEVSGLAPDRWYFYRFRAGEAVSPVGRTRTLPPAGQAMRALRLAVASCQNYEDGYYAAWRHLAADNPDLILHLGDYIYEMRVDDGVRHHATPYCSTLDEYRVRHAQYKLDADLCAAHAAAPFFATWDDHDVQNDYAGAVPQDFSPAERFLQRRASAYQAYYEHLPLRASSRPRGPDAALYRRAVIGDLATLHVLDSRQYRDDQACPRPGQGGGRLVDPASCPALGAPARTLLGRRQEAWLDAGLRGAATRWNVVAQQLLMASLDQKPGTGDARWSDSWDGYPAARDRLLAGVAAPGVADTVVLGGDIHSFWATDLAHEGRVVATEFTGTSISSRGVPQEMFARVLPENPHVRFFDARWRGYMRCEVSPGRWRTDFVALDDARRADSSARVLKSFEVERGRPGIAA